ncbi:KGG domain-containing protein, partial [Diaphorobacter nitroreducens]|uniref:KGG domain-containing protein n=1 Tax=Diaphorobacter nitroreducens TaxID=164759 RepID=UPI0028A72288
LGYCQGSRDNNQGQSGSGRGFASMDPDRQREIAAEGGRAAHASGNAHEFTSQEARAAGAKSHGGGGNNASSGSGNTRGGSSEQQARAGSQSHKNDR